MKQKKKTDTFSEAKIKVLFVKISKENFENQDDVNHVL